MGAEAWSFAGSVVVGILAMIGVIYSSNATRKTNEAVTKNQMDTIANQIKALELKQDKHNSVIERTYGLEKAQAEISRDVKTLYNNLDEVKCDVKEVRNEFDGLTQIVNSIKEEEIRLQEQLKQ